MATDNHSRVILDVTNGSLESDYINASYIDVRIKCTDWLLRSRLRASLCYSLVVLRCELGTRVCFHLDWLDSNLDWKHLELDSEVRRLIKSCFKSSL